MKLCEFNHMIKIRILKQAFFCLSALAVRAFCGITDCSTLDEKGLVEYAQYSTVIAYAKVSAKIDTNVNLYAYGGLNLSNKIRTGWKIQIIENIAASCSNNSIEFINIDPFYNTRKFTEDNIRNPQIVLDSSYLFFLSLDLKASYEIKHFIFTNRIIMNRFMLDSIKMTFGRNQIRKCCPDDIIQIYKTKNGETFSSILNHFYGQVYYLNSFLLLNNIQNINTLVPNNFSKQSINSQLRKGTFLIIPKKECLVRFNIPKKP